MAKRAASSIVVDQEGQGSQTIAAATTPPAAIHAVGTLYAFGAGTHAYIEDEDGNILHADPIVPESGNGTNFLAIDVPPIKVSGKATKLTVASEQGKAYAILHYFIE